MPEITLDNGNDKNQGDNQEKPIGAMTTTMTMKPVLICHSFGGIVAMKYLETMYERDHREPKDLISGIVSLCSVPPSGLNPMIFRSMWKSFCLTWKVIKGIPMKKATTDPKLCRYLFFDGPPSSGCEGKNDDFDISDMDLARYQNHFLEDSKSVIDVGHLSKNVPSKKVDTQGHAPFVSCLPQAILVVAAQHDKIVDMDGNFETATYYGLSENDVVVVDSPHDVMLSRNWRMAAEAIGGWLERQQFA